jgi:hypothetical protein
MAGGMAGGVAGGGMDGGMGSSFSFLVTSFPFRMCACVF